MKELISLNDHFFIAGGSGMVGRSICKKLKKSNYGKKENKGAISYPTRKELNLLSYGEVFEWFKKFKPSVVIIAAGKVGGIKANSKYPSEFILENLKIQTNLIDISWKFNVKRLLFLGSSCIYPKNAAQPIKEENLLKDSLDPSNEWYSIAKIAGIKSCQALRLQYGFDAISLMPTNLYGPGDNYNLVDSHVLPAFIRKFNDAKELSKKVVTCWGSGNPLREFMHVDDLASACLFVLKYWDTFSNDCPLDEKNEPLLFLNVGSGNEISIKKLAKIIAFESGFEGDIKWDLSKPDGTPRKLLDIQKIRAIGWKSSIDLKEGIRRTINDYKKEIAEGTIRR